MKKNLLKMFGLLGVMLFIPLFLFTFSDPHKIEESGRLFIEWKLKSEVNKKIDSIELPEYKKTNNLLGKISKKINLEANKELEKFKQLLKKDVPKLVMEQIAKVSNIDCECRLKWEERLIKSLKLKIISFEQAKDRLADFTQAKYMEIVKKLTLDIRIFLGANSVVFLFLLLISFLKPRATEHLFLPASLMLVSTIICSYFYMFEQNWFYTIISNNYTGFGYLAYLVIIFLFLCDIVFNKAKVTTEVINYILNAIGSALSVTSC